MKIERNYIDELREELPKFLGEDYTVVTEINNDLYIPDLVIENRTTAERTVVELQGSSDHNDLPLGSIPTLRRWRDVLSPKYNNFIVLSLSNIPDIVKESLNKYNIGIIKIDDTKNYMGDLKEFVVNR